MECYLELCLCAFVGIYGISSENGSYVFSSIYTIAMMLLAITIPTYLCFFVVRRTKYLSDESYLQKYISLFEMLKVERPAHTAFVFLFVLRRLFFTLLAIYFKSFGMSLFFLQSVMMGAYLIYFKPFHTRKANYIETFNEETVTAVGLLFMMCDQNLSDPDIKYVIGWAIIGAVLTNILVNNVIVMIESI